MRAASHGRAAALLATITSSPRLASGSAPTIPGRSTAPPTTAPPTTGPPTAEVDAAAADAKAAGAGISGACGGLTPPAP
jgi:hypothetical protein